MCWCTSICRALFWSWVLLKDSKTRRGRLRGGKISFLWKEVWYFFTGNQLASFPFGVIPLAESSRLGGYCVFAMGGMCICIFARAGVRVFDARTPAPHHLFFCIGYWIASPMERGVFYYHYRECHSMSRLSLRPIGWESGYHLSGTLSLGGTRLCFSHHSIFTWKPFTSDDHSSTYHVSGYWPLWSRMCSAQRVRLIQYFCALVFGTSPLRVSAICGSGSTTAFTSAVSTRH